MNTTKTLTPDHEELPLIEVTELPRATLEEREILLDLGIIDNTGVLNNDY